MTTRVAVVHEVVSPYRTPLFSALAHRPAIDLTVVLCGEREPRRSWTVELNRVPYPWIMSPSWSFGIGRAEKGTCFVPLGLGSTLDQLQPDVLVVGGYASAPAALALSWARRRKRPVIMWSESIRTGRGGLIRWLKRANVARANAYAVPGRLAAQHLVSLGANPSSIFQASNCIDLTRFRPLRRPPATPRRLLLCGQLIPRKGWHLVPVALAHADPERRAELLVVGEGPGRRHLEESFAARGIRATFTGHVEYDDLPEVLREADSVVFPSLDDVWGFALQEAMACGLPAIASDQAGATSELLHHGRNGWVVKPEVASIARALKILLALSPLEWASMSACARASSARLSIAQAVQGFERAIVAAQAS